MSAREQFDALFGDRTARAARTSALDGGLRQCTIRSIVWRVFLELLPGQVDEEAWKQATRRNRERYQQLVEELMINPEEDDDTDPMLDNPLMASEETDSKWSQFFEDEEIQKEIMNDVTRTYPDIEFFRRETTQTFLMRVLFIWVKLHPDLGYRQGMNELLAPLALILSREYGEDSIAGGTARPYGDDDPDSIIRFLLDDTYLEHDAFFIFDKVMEAMMPLYITEGGSNTGSALRGQMNALGGRGENVNLSVQRCKDVHKLLEKADPEVYQHIAKKHQIEPQLYILRWLRLIFTREFHIDDVILIWDAILADSSQLRLIDYISVSMIMFIRQNLLDFTDVSQVLARLMKYPPVESIMVIVDKALIIAGGTAGGTCNMQPTMSYGHMPRRAEKPTLPTPLPAAPRNATTSVPKLSAVQEENSSVEAFAETAVKAARDLFSMPEEQESKPKPPDPKTGFTPRPGYGDVPNYTARSDSNTDPLSTFDSPTSTTSDTGFVAPGDQTHRKMATSFGPGAIEGDVLPIQSPDDQPRSKPASKPAELALPVEISVARKKVVKLVVENEAPDEVLELFDGANNWQEEQTREYQRSVAERLDHCVGAIKDLLTAAQDADQETLKQATKAVADLEAVKSCLILGGQLPPKSD